MELNFQLPQEFRHPDKFNPSDVGDDFFMNVPSVVAAAIFDAIGENVPIDPTIPLIYLRSDRLPQFVPAWFMAAMPTGGKRLGKSTKFYRALHAIERYREYIMYPADPAIPEFILAGAGAVPPHHFAPGSGPAASLDELQREADRLREAAGSDVTKDAEDKVLMMKILTTLVSSTTKKTTNEEEFKFCIKLCFLREIMACH